MRCDGIPRTIESATIGPPFGGFYAYMLTAMIRRATVMQSFLLAGRAGTANRLSHLGHPWQYRHLTAHALVPCILGSPRHILEPTIFPVR